MIASPQWKSLARVERARLPRPQNVDSSHMSAPHLENAQEFPDLIESARLSASKALNRSRRSALGQFFTPLEIARLMASLTSAIKPEIRLLDPGAGAGTLAAAWLWTICSRERRPERLSITAYELDEALIPTLTSVLTSCVQYGREKGIEVDFDIENRDFIRESVQTVHGGLFEEDAPQFDIAILNPPYKKFRTDSRERSMLREIGLETSNLYAAFVGLAARRLKIGGELVAITPRSFCNGPYFTPFRRDLLSLGSLSHVHVFDSRSAAFGSDDVLQENVIFRLERGSPQSKDVHIEWSSAGDVASTERRSVPFSDVVRPDDSDVFIHIAAADWDSEIARLIRSLSGTLPELGIQVSTGRVVDFRARPFLQDEPGPDTAPLIYPAHFDHGRIVWPRTNSRKPNAIQLTEETTVQLNPKGTYVLTKRFSAKEEPRRIVSAVLFPEGLPGDFVAFENHLNYFHRRGHGLPREQALGLSAFLNSTVVDSYFRQFNGHTQVNATDLRKLPYPSAEQLQRLGNRIGDACDQHSLDEIVEEELFEMPAKSKMGTTAQRRIAEACEILRELGLPKEQTNERAAITLLALLNLAPKDSWSKAAAPLMGVTPIMEFAADHYDKRWKPNTRETVRRFTLHQFEDADLVHANPDKPDRPVNSPAYCYQVTSNALALLQSYGTGQWSAGLKSYLKTVGTLKAQYANQRQMRRIPLRASDGSPISLSPGGQNELIRKIIEEFCSRFTPGGRTLYIGDADAKWGYSDGGGLAELGVKVQRHGKMPDVVIHHAKKNWLVLIEAVTSHGPVDAKRHGELKKLFKGSKAPLVFVTAFPDRQTFNRFMSAIAWETEVWVADAPTHMIHFNGERFLGPY